MKRFVSVLLTAIMIFSVFSLSGFAQNNKAEEYFEKINNNVNEFTVKGIQYGYELEHGVRFTMCRKGNSIAFESEIPIDDEMPSIFGKIKVVIKDESVKMFFPLIPFVSIEVPSETVEDVLFDVGNLDLSFVSGEERDLDGLKCFVETYNNEDGSTVEYTFCDEELILITAKDSDGALISEMHIEEISYSAKWYQFLTPLVTIDLNDGFIDIDDLKISGIF